jgi:hypothetical protein
MAVEIWLERLTIISMDKDSTPANDAKEGSTALMPTQIQELADITKWIKDNDVCCMVFWDWLIKEEVARLCPKILFFNNDDAVYFTMVWG